MELGKLAYEKDVRGCRYTLPDQEITNPVQGPGISEGTSFQGLPIACILSRRSIHLPSMSIVVTTIMEKELAERAGEDVQEAKDGCELCQGSGAE